MARFWEMPAASPTMDLGLIVEWKLAEGAAFSPGTVAVVVGTDKANMEVEIYEKGVLLRHLAAPGDEVPPGFPIAIWGDAGDDVTGLLAEFAARQASRAPAASAAKPATTPPPPAPPPPPAQAEPSAGVLERPWHGRPTHLRHADPPGDLRLGAPSRRPRSSPLARRVAEERGVDLRRVTGTGPGGRIVRADVDNAPLGRPERPNRTDEVVRHSPMRRTIARRLASAHQEIPVFSLTTDIDMGPLVSLREALKARGTAVSLNDLVLFAVSRSLTRHPEINASWADDAVTRRASVDLGMAVALPTGLITPVIRGADALSLADLAREARSLVEKAREGKLTTEEYSGNSFTVSNLGMLGIEQFTAIINPPASAILAVGALRREPALTGDHIGIGHRMKVTLCCDHRVIDGAVGATFLQTLRGLMSTPALLWMEP